ncbi:MAG: glycosyltransferase family 2 protein [Armatimonadota bacterium]|nr:glycosyltransferase [Armatimonadota bacterium]MDW8155695.1 glycosyltransferase family 2 protein [Armatimonadota bacterium]
MRVVRTLLALRFFVVACNALWFPTLRPAAKRGCVRASILVPARNEARNLPRTLPTLLVQDADEVLVLDDGSEDGTAEVARVVANGHPRLRVLPGRPVPPGWRGKTWACWQLAVASRGDVLVFTDADVAWRPGALGALLRALERFPVVSAWPGQESVELWSGLMVNFLLHGAYGFLPHAILRRLGWANGQVLAVRRNAYFAAGGHRAVRQEVLEDVALARRIGELGLFRAPGLFRTAMYRSWGEAVEGFGKNLLDVHGRSRLVLLASAAYHLVLYTVPWAVDRRAALAGVVERLILQRMGRGPWWLALLTPLAPLLFLPAYGRALRGLQRWKGRLVG